MSRRQRENQRGMAAMASAFASPVSVASAGRSATGATRATLASRGAGGVAVADETGTCHGDCSAEIKTWLENPRTGALEIWFHNV